MTKKDEIIELLKTQIELLKEEVNLLKIQVELLKDNSNKTPFYPSYPVQPQIVPLPYDPTNPFVYPPVIYCNDNKEDDLT